MKQKRIPGIIAVLIQLIASVCFMVLLYQTKLIPNKLLLIIGGILLFITLVILLLTIDFKHRGRFFCRGFADICHSGCLCAEWQLCN